MSNLRDGLRVFERKVDRNGLDRSPGNGTGSHNSRARRLWMRWSPLALAALVATALAGTPSGIVASAATSALASPSNQTIRYPNQEPLKLDPGLNCCGPDVRVSLSLFDPLVAFDNAGNVLPLAARGWDVSPDGLTYTFHLRAGMKWSDGRPVTASDFEYAWKRVADPKLASDYAFAVYIIKGHGKYFDLVAAESKTRLKGKRGNT